MFWHMLYMFPVQIRLALVFGGGLALFLVVGAVVDYIVRHWHK